MQIFVLAFLIYIWLWTPKWLIRFNDNLYKTLADRMEEKRRERENENND